MRTLTEQVMKACISSVYRVYVWLIPLQIRDRIGPSFLRLITRIMMMIMGNKIKTPAYIMHVDAKDWYGCLLFSYHYNSGRFVEHYSLDLFLNCIRLNSGCVVIDLGASYGLYTLEVLGMKDQSAVSSMISVEPDNRIFSLLSRSVHESGFQNRVSLINAAVTDSHNSTCELHLWHKNFSKNIIVSPGQSFIEPLSKPFKHSYQVPGVTLDGLLIDHEIDPTSRFLIKMDIEGGEPAAFVGMEMALKQSQGYIFFCELNYSQLAIHGYDRWILPDNIISLNPDHVMWVNDINGQIAPLKKREDFNTVFEIMNDQDIDNINIIFVKNMSLPPELA